MGFFGLSRSVHHFKPYLLLRPLTGAAAAAQGFRVGGQRRSRGRSREAWGIAIRAFVREKPGRPDHARLLSRKDAGATLAGAGIRVRLGRGSALLAGTGLRASACLVAGLRGQI
ncbi:hypothetical protein BS78_07G058300 [Paspalum vaginatum]|nr:hypothetical protein BS78_07G058300 [Paspalum vaginatum]